MWPSVPCIVCNHCNDFWQINVIKNSILVGRCWRSLRLSARWQLTAGDEIIMSRRNLYYFSVCEYNAIHARRFSSLWNLNEKKHIIWQKSASGKTFLVWKPKRYTCVRDSAFACFCSMVFGCAELLPFDRPSRTNFWTALLFFSVGSQ